MKRARREILERMQAAQERFTDLLYEIRWRPADETAYGAETADEGVWLLLADAACPTAEAIAAELRRTGRDCRLVRAGGENPEDVVDPRRPKDIETLLRRLAEHPDKPVARIIVLWGVDDVPGENDGLDDVHAFLERTCGGLLHLVAALAERRARLGRPRLIPATRGGQRVRENDIPAPLAGTLWGMQKSIGNEHPEFSSLIVDLDPADDGSDIGLFCRAAAGDGGEEQLAIRGGALFTPRLVPAKAEAGRRIPPALPDGVEAFCLEIPKPGIDNLRAAPMTRRAPGAGEIEIAVKAVGLNFRDVMLAMGVNPARTNALGTDCAGVVAAVGEGVSELREGDRIVATAYGSMASHVIAPAASASPMPETLAFAEAATIPTAFMTARHALHDVGGLDSESLVFLPSAAGGVGLAALQIARAAGARVFASAGDARKRALLRSLGVERVFHSRRLDFAEGIMEATGGRGVDMVLNFLTGEFVDKGLSILAPGGRFLEIGKTDIRDPADVAAVRSDVSYHVIDLERMGYEEGGRLRGIFDAVMAGFDKGLFRPLPLRTFPLDRAGRAFHYMAEARHIGKVVLVNRPEAETNEQGIRPEGSYLITGGLGQLGLALARRLVDMGARRLALSGRRPPSEEAAAAMAELRDRGAVVKAFQADIADPEDTARLLRDVREGLAPPAGVFHLAGVLDDDPLVRLDWPRFSAVTAPKIDGAWLLHRLTRDMDLDHFVLFSSMASIFGTHGQANHVAANTFLDALAHYRRADYRPALSINWGAWGGIGSVARLGIEDRIQAQGIKTFEPETGLAALERLLAGDAVQTAVLAVDWPRLLPILTAGGRGRFFAEITAGRERTETAENGRAPVREALSRLPVKEREERLRAYLKREIAHFLRIREQDVPDEENLVRLGMDSLISLDLFQRISRDLQIRIAPHEISAKPTVAAMAEVFARDIGPDDSGDDSGDGSAPETEGGEPAIPAAPAAAPSPEDRFLPFPLSDMQQAYLIGRSPMLELGGVGCHFYLEAESGTLDLTRYDRAWNSLIARRDMLRTVILDSGVQQVLEETPPFRVERIDLRGLPADVREQRLLETRRALDHEVPAVDQWPPFRIVASILKDDLVRIHFSFDLLISDFRGINTLLMELGEFYRDPEAALPEPEFTFRDYRLAEEAYRKTPAHQQAKQYWLDRLDTLPPAPKLPLARRPSEIGTPRFTRRSRRLPAETWRRLRERAAADDLPPTGVLLAAFALTIGFFSAKPRFTLNLTLFNRLPVHPQVQDIVGEFTSNSLLEVDLERPLPFGRRAAQLWKQLWKDMEHRSFSGVQVLRELARSGRAGEPRMPVVFTSALGLDAAENNGPVPTGLGREIYSISQTPQVWLDHQVFAVGDELLLVWDAVEELFPPGLLDDMFSVYTDLLERAAEDEIWSLVRPLRPPQRQRELRAEVNATEAPFLPRPLYAPFLERAARCGDRTAVAAPDRRLTYDALERRSRRVRDLLRGAGEGSGRLVAVVMEKGWEQAVAILGVLRAGAAYLPVDADTPEHRLRVLLQDGAVSTALTQRRLVKRFARPEGVSLHAVDELPEAEGPADADADVSGDDLAYVIYTSGSTGRPKGVMISHGAALNTVLDINRRFGVDEKDRISAISRLGFDLSVYDIFGALAAGAVLVVPGPEQALDPVAWLDLIRSEEITVWNSAPALARLLVDAAEQAGEDTALPLRLALVSGDWIPLDLAQRLKRRAPDVRVIGLGGATEASIWSNFHEIDAVDPSWTAIPYGRPLANQQLAVLDRNFADRPEWVPGELFIAGAGLSLGYWNDPEKTADRFVTHPASGRRLYRTGDLAGYLPNGEVEFLGREDMQVQVRGLRVEPGEIETALKNTPGVRDAAVTARRGSPHADARLTAFVVGDGTADTDIFRRETAEAPLVAARRRIMAEAPALLDNIRPAALDPDRFLPAWERFCGLYLAAARTAFEQLGILSGAPSREEDMVVRAGVAPRYGGWMRRAAKALRRAGLIRRDDQGRLSPGDPAPDLEASLAACLADGEELGFDASETELLARTVRNLAGILKEDIHSAELYADQGLPGLYRKLFGAGNRLLAEIVRAAAESSPPDAPLRVLEVGAGYGSAAEHILPAAPPDRTRYVFTDISRFFLSRAATTFAEFPFVDFALLDLDRDPLLQGQPLHGYDLIIASNMFHDVKDVRRSLRRAASLLAPAGLLVMLEETRFHTPFDLTMGLQQGFDGFSDDDLRREHPLLSRQAWKDALVEQGFSDAAVVCGPETVEGRLGVDVIVARAPDTALHFQPEVLRRRLLDRLPAYMAPERMVLLEELPLNASGKVDRKALAAANDEGPAKSKGPAPQTPTEKAVAAVWSELLSLPRVGVQDNFFTVGGDSLLALQLASRLKQRFAVDIPLHDLLQAPTIAAQAVLLDDGTRSAGETPLLPLAPEGDGPPLCLAHPIEGLALCYAGTARALADVPVYGLQSRGLDGASSPLEDLPAMAADYLRAVAPLARKGPIFLGGWSMGAFIAFEMARQATEQRNPPPALILIDPPGKTDWDRLYDTRRDDPPALFELVVPDPKGAFAAACVDVGDAPQEQRMRLFLEGARQTGQLPLDADAADRFGAVLDVLRANLAALRAYRPTPFPSPPILYVQAADQPDEARLDYWRGLASGGFEVLRVPGDHWSLLRDPDNARRLARELAPLLSRLQSGKTVGGEAV